MLTYVKSGSIFHLYVLFFHCMFLSENILMVITITMFHLQINNIMTKLKSKAPIFFQMAHIKNKCGLLSMSLATLHGLYVLLFLLCIVQGKGLKMNFYETANLNENFQPSGSGDIVFQVITIYIMVETCLNNIKIVQTEVLCIYLETKTQYV